MIWSRSASGWPMGTPPRAVSDLCPSPRGGGVLGTWDQVAGQDQAVREIRAGLARGGGGRAWRIIGPSGSGKTTLARLIAAEGATEFGLYELDAGSVTPAKLREVERGYACRALCSPGIAVIVNEFHRLRRDTVAALLDVLERLPEYVVWIFTSTHTGQASLFEDDVAGDCAPFLSRCQLVILEDGPESRRALAVRAKTVAMKAGCDGLPEQEYIAAMDGCNGNMRALLQRVESGQLNRMAKIRAELQRPLGQQEPRRREQLQAQLAQMGG